MSFLNRFWTRLTGGERSLDANASASGGTQPASAAKVNDVSHGARR
jgi:hypothetical protein